MSPKDLDRYIIAYKTIQEFNTIEIKESNITALPILDIDYKKVI